MCLIFAVQQSDSIYMFMLCCALSLQSCPTFCDLPGSFVHDKGHVYILIHNLFHYGLSQDIEYSSKFFFLNIYFIYFIWLHWVLVTYSMWDLFPCRAQSLTDWTIQEIHPPPQARGVFFFFNNFIYLGFAGSSLLWGLFSIYSERGLFSRCSAWVSPCSGSSCGGWALEHVSFSSCGIWT